MIRQSKKGETVKKQLERSHSDARKGSSGDVERHQPIFEEIDPADFFDPEEFGGRREDPKSLPA